MLASHVPGSVLETRLRRTRSSLRHQSGAVVVIAQTRRAKLSAKNESTHKLSRAVPAHRLALFLESQEGHSVCLALSDWRHQRLPSAGAYRCWAESTRFLQYEVSPVLDLSVRVDPDGRSATVSLDSASLEGSTEVQAQSQRFVPSASHVISWEETGKSGAVSTLLSRVELGVELEVFASPLSLLPRSVVERPGSALLRSMIVRSQAGFLVQLEAAFLEWDSRTDAPVT